MTMPSLKAHVRSGRLVLDEATELVELVPLDEVLANGGDDLDGADRVVLHAELEASIAEFKVGKSTDADDALRELRAMK